MAAVDGWVRDDRRLLTCVCCGMLCLPERSVAALQLGRCDACVFHGPWPPGRLGVHAYV